MINTNEVEVIKDILRTYSTTRTAFERAKEKCPCYEFLVSIGEMCYHHSRSSAAECHITLCPLKGE